MGFAIFVGMATGLALGLPLLVFLVYKVETARADTADYLADRITWEELQRRQT